MFVASYGYKKFAFKSTLPESKKFGLFTKNNKQLYGQYWSFRVLKDCTRTFSDSVYLRTKRTRGNKIQSFEEEKAM